MAKKSKKTRCPPLWRKNKVWGCEPGPKHPYTLAKKAAIAAGYTEQSCGEISGSPVPGARGTNFYKGEEVFHISLNPWEDEETIEAMKEK